MARVISSIGKRLRGGKRPHVLTDYRLLTDALALTSQSEDNYTVIQYTFDFTQERWVVTSRTVGKSLSTVSKY